VTGAQAERDEARSTIAAVDLIAVLIVILIVALIWRGPKTLPQIGAMLGRGVREARHEADRLRTGDGPDEERPKAG
jgi:Sec-independent protein translocase protein TatA